MGKRLYREYDENCNLIKLECGSCREIKTVNKFYKSKSGKDGYTNKCKLCIKEHHKQYHEENKEKLNKHNRQYYQENKEKILKHHKQYKENNKEKIIERNRQYYQENKEKILKHHKQYKENNKEKISERNRQYYQENKEKISKYHKQYSENNKEKIFERHRQYYENNKEKIIEYNRQYRENNKEIVSKSYQKWHENKTVEEIKRIYENVTKNLYPNNGIQYGIIYGVHCINTDRWYIGQTRKTFNLRYHNNFFKRKFIELLGDNEKIHLLQDDIEKYGQESFEIFEVIDVAFSEKELDEKECYYIDYYKAYDEGYNSNRGNIFKHGKSKRKDVI